MDKAAQDTIKSFVAEVINEALHEHTKDFFMTEEEIENVKKKAEKSLKKRLGE
jgi:F0F1-type ATP synthase membrane subunit b/b'